MPINKAMDIEFNWQKNESNGVSCKGKKCSKEFDRQGVVTCLLYCLKENTNEANNFGGQGEIYGPATYKNVKPR